MRVIGITGPTGAGKTTLLREVERLGGAVIDCDLVYHQLLKSDTALQEKLEKEFGEIRDDSGGIDRKKLGALVFSDPEKLECLNRIAQLATVNKSRQVLEQLRAQGTALAAIDAIALLESSLHGLCDVTVAVVAPREVRVERIMAREGISKEYAWSRVLAQKPEHYFTNGCDYTLVNDCSSAEEFSKKAAALLNAIIGE